MLLVRMMCTVLIRRGQMQVLPDLVVGQLPKAHLRPWRQELHPALPVSELAPPLSLLALRLRELARDSCGTACQCVVDLGVQA